VIEDGLFDELSAFQGCERGLQQGGADLTVVDESDLAVASFYDPDFDDAGLNGLCRNERSSQGVPVIMVEVADAGDSCIKFGQGELLAFRVRDQRMQRGGIDDGIADNPDDLHGERGR